MFLVANNLGSVNKVDIPYSVLGVNLICDARIFDKKYLYEMSSFFYSGIYVNFQDRIKYVYRVLDMKKNLVSNDIHAKYFNELKTIFERNIHLYRFMSKMLKFKPLNKFGIIRKQINDIFVKQAEVNFLSGKQAPFRVLNLDVNKNAHFYQERNVYSVIPSFTKTLFYKGLNFVKHILHNISLFITFKKRRKFLKTYILGFKLILKNKTHIKWKSKFYKRLNIIMKFISNYIPKVNIFIFFKKVLRRRKQNKKIATNVKRYRLFKNLNNYSKYNYYVS